MIFLDFTPLICLLVGFIANIRTGFDLLEYLTLLAALSGFKLQTVPFSLNFSTRKN